MILLYKDLTKKGYNDYQIKKMLQQETLFMVEKGIYTTNKKYDRLECIVKKHPNAIVTLESACHCYGLLSKYVSPYVIATKQKDRKIKDIDIKQIFMTDTLYPIGSQTITYHGYTIHIYDLERLLIEVLRNKTNIEYEHYHTIIQNYKKIWKLLNQTKLKEYLQHFKDPKIIDRLKKEFK